MLKKNDLSLIPKSPFSVADSEATCMPDLATGYCCIIFQ